MIELDCVPGAKWVGCFECDRWWSAEAWRENGCPHGYEMKIYNHGSIVASPRNAFKDLTVTSVDENAGAVTVNTITIEEEKE